MANVGQGLRATLGRLMGREQGCSEELRLTDPGERCVLVWLLEFPATDIAADLKRVADQLRRRRVVFVHSGVDFSPMVAAGVIFEALPPLAAMRAHRGLLDWGAWVSDRIALLQTVWAPDRAITYGMPPEAYMAEANAIACGTAADAGRA